jgi:hypothetical protein
VFVEQLNACVHLSRSSKLQIIFAQVVGLAGDTAKSVFRGECAPGPVSPAHCEVQHMGVEIAAGQAGQLRFWTADRWLSPLVMLMSTLQLTFLRHRLANLDVRLLASAYLTCIELRSQS